MIAYVNERGEVNRRGGSDELRAGNAKLRLARYLPVHSRRFVALAEHIVAFNCILTTSDYVQLELARGQRKVAKLLVP